MNALALDQEIKKIKNKIEVAENFIEMSQEQRRDAYSGYIAVKTLIRLKGELSGLIKAKEICDA